MFYIMCVTLFILIVIIVDAVNQADIRRNNRMKLGGDVNDDIKWGHSHW